MAEPVVECAAAVLEEQSETIVARWLKRLPEETPSLPRDLSLEEAENAAPQVLHGIADALRLGQPWELEAPWAAAARRHAEQRLRQGEALRDLLREFQLLREEVWAALAEQLRPASASEVFALARSLDAHPRQHGRQLGPLLRGRAATHRRARRAPAHRGRV